MKKEKHIDVGFDKAIPLYRGDRKEKKPMRANKVPIALRSNFNSLRTFEKLPVGIRGQCCIRRSLRICRSSPKGKGFEGRLFLSEQRILYHVDTPNNEMSTPLGKYFVDGRERTSYRSSPWWFHSCHTWAAQLPSPNLYSCGKTTDQWRIRLDHSNNYPRKWKISRESFVPVEIRFEQ